MRLIAIAGPTGIRKTELAIKFIKNACIISCDSVMIYKELNIGSNKEHDEKHMLMNLRTIKDKYDVNDFVNDFIDILEFGKDYILVGGCGLYMDRAIQSYNIMRECFTNILSSKNKINWNLTEDEIHKNIGLMNNNIEHYMQNKFNTNAPHLYETYEIEDANRQQYNKTKYSMDNSTNNVANHNNEYSTNYTTSMLDIEKIHLVRKIEQKIIIYLKKKFQDCDYNELRIDQCYSFYLTCKRKNLYRKIDERCEVMVLNGLFDELIHLKKIGLTKDLVIGRSIGYRDGLHFIENMSDDMSANLQNFDIFLNNFKKRSRNYARKQETWYKNKEYIFVNKDEYDAYEIIQMIIENKIEEFNDRKEMMHQHSLITNKDAKKDLKTYNSKNKHINNEKVKEIIERIKNETK
ncbi:hypothetical protein BDAP_002005 [Binucleata daphniae]